MEREEGKEGVERVDFRYRDLRPYKYQLTAEYRHPLDLRQIRIPHNAYNTFVRIEDGELILKEGYAWDGPSGPTVDTDTFMRGSLVHDGLYQLLQNRHLPPEDLRKTRLYADRLLREICFEDGMNPFRAWYVYLAVRYFGWVAIR